eukprot:maker-scaffold_34-snap-gene-0.0-mRNA-1 protein AED:0.28 eAED:0.28 QI:37/1/1/1/0.75/0.6/5/672/190
MLDYHDSRTISNLQLFLKMVQVYLNIYKIKKKGYMKYVCIDAYHTGIVFGGIEYSFSNNGVENHTPKLVNDCDFIQQIELGSTRIDNVRRKINELKEDKFGPGLYDPLKRNCNHFTDAVSLGLFNIKNPSFINRAAKYGAKVVRDVSGKKANGEADGNLEEEVVDETALKAKKEKQRQLLQKARANKSHK